MGKKKSIHKNPAVIAAYIGVVGMVIAAVVTGIVPQFFQKPTPPEPKPSVSGISSGGGNINIGTGESSQATLVMGDQETTTINYYNTDPKVVNELKQQLKLKDRTITTLLDTIDKNNIPASQQTEKFKELAEKYAALQQRLNKYEHDTETKAAVKEALDAGDLDKAEQLLKQANAKDELLIEERQQAVAERTFNLAEISELKYDFPTALKRYKKVVQYQPDNLDALWKIAEISEMLGNSQQALMAWQQLQPKAQEQGNPRIHNVALASEAAILAKHGYSSMALDKYQQAHQYFIQRTESDPNNSEWQRDLSVSYERIGDMHKANGDGDKALNAYKGSLTICDKLVKRDPNNSDWQHDLSVSYDRIGDMHQANGDSNKALKAYQDSLNIRDNLVKIDMSNSEWQRDLSVSFNKIGDMHQANGDGDKAINAYQDSLTIRDKLAKRDPNNSDWQRDLSVSFNKIGDIHQANGDNDKALDAYQNALKIIDKLAKYDPNNKNWQRDLSVSFNKIGDIHQANGDDEKALKTYQDSLTIREKLAKQSPNSVELQRDLMVSYVRLSETMPQDKKKYLQQALAILLKLDQSNRLYAEDKWIIAELKEQLDNISSN